MSHNFIHILLLFARRHSVENASVETSFRFFISHFVILNARALSFGKAVAVLVFFEHPTLFFHLLERCPTVIPVVLTHCNKREKKVVEPSIFLAGNCRLRRVRRYPTLSPKEIAFFKVFHYLVHKLLSLRRKFLIRRILFFTAQRQLSPPLLLSARRSRTHRRRNPSGRLSYNLSELR